jgi:phage FluMu protein Com
MLLRKKEVKCEKCKVQLFDIPLYLSNFHIDIKENWEGYREEWLRGDLEWYCPKCQKLNRDSIKLLLGENSYIAILKNRFSEYHAEEVRYD